MPVDPILSVAIYIIWWWMALFMVLPIGVRNLGEAGIEAKGSDPGAPEKPMLGKKALWAAGLALIFWVATMAFIIINPLGFER
jgi:predicted secreted protein